MNRQRSKAEILDIILVVFGLYCLLGAVRIVVTDFFWSLIQSTDHLTISRNPWVSGVYAVIMLSLSYISLFHRKAILALLLKEAPEQELLQEDGFIPCYTATAFWVQMCGLYELVTSVFYMAQTLILDISIRGDDYPRGNLWKQEAPSLVVLVLAIFLIWKSRTIGQYLDRLRGTVNTL